MDLDALDTDLAERGEPAYRGAQLRQAVLRDLAHDWSEVTTLPKVLRAELAEEYPFSTVTVTDEQTAADGTVKLRLTTADGSPLEAVLMRYATGDDEKERYTACLSSQSGCALACSFCATGAMGFGRNLSSWEIVDQFLELARRRVARGEGRIDNVVMMGMGEPFHNYDRVLGAIRVLNSSDGVGLGARRIAISTAGWIPGIDKLADEPLQVKLALSLHAPNDELRAELMPVNRRFPLADLMAACERYQKKTKKRIFVEYLMLDGVNDAPSHADELVDLLAGGGFHVNLIAYNPTEAGYRRASDDVVRRFGQRLRAAGIGTSYRISRGSDIDAACGQLAVAGGGNKKVRH